MAITESSPSQAHVASPDWGVYALVWGTWAFMLLALLGFVARYSYNGPGLWDELGRGFVAILVGERPLTAEWLWKPLAEHRIPLPKLILWVLARLTGGDFRASLFVTAFGLGALAFIMIRAAASIRGSLTYTDVTFPLVLLNWGHAVGLLQAVTSAFPLTTLVSGIALVIIARSAPSLARKEAALFGICLLLLPLLGGGGALLVPALAFWFVVSATLRWRSAIAPLSQEEHELTPPSDGAAAATGNPSVRGPCHPGIMRMMGAASALALVCVGYASGNVVVTRVDSPWVLLRTSLQFVSQIFGPGAESAWPLSGLGALLLLFAGAIALVVVWHKQPEDRHRVLGLSCFLTGFALNAFVIGWKRPDMATGRGITTWRPQRFAAHTWLA